MKIVSLTQILPQHTKTAVKQYIHDYNTKLIYKHT